MSSPHYTYTSLNNNSSITTRIFHWNPYFSVRYPLLIWFQRHESAQVYSITSSLFLQIQHVREANLTHSKIKSWLVYFFCCMKYLAARTFSASLNQFHTSTISKILPLLLLTTRARASTSLPRLRAFTSCHHIASPQFISFLCLKNHQNRLLA